MTNREKAASEGINRRTVLQGVGAISAAGLVGVPAFSGSVLGIHQEDCPDDTVLLATENNHPAIGDTEMDANIYAIYPAVGVVTPIESHTLPVNGTVNNQGTATTDNFNGNAWDDGSQRFYFSRYDRLGPAGGNPLPSELYFTELDGDDTATHAGTLQKASAGAAFYMGDYYYIPQRTDELRKVSFNPDGTIASDLIVANNLLSGGAVFGFGDITFQGDVIFGSATVIGNGYTVVFFRMDSDGTNYSVIETGGLYGAGGTQISFGKDGVLYGVNARSPYEVFSVATANGDTTYIQDLPVAFSDVSNGPLCEECVPCNEDGLLAKFEFDCVEEVEDECVDRDFVLEDGDGGLISYEAGSFEADEDGEPITATFGTDLCELWAVVKSGQEFSVQKLMSDDGTVTVENTDPFAISFVAFFCTEAAAKDFAENFPSNGRGGGRGR